MVYTPGWSLLVAGLWGIVAGYFFTKATWPNDWWYFVFVVVGVVFLAWVALTH